MKKMSLWFCLAFVSTSAHAFLSRSYNIEQLSQKASIIFMGEVTKVQPSPETTDAHVLPYIEVYFKVFEGFKGGVPSVYSFKQFAPKVGKQFQLLGMSKNAYVVGQKLVMFLGSASSNTGFSAPENFELFALQTKSNRQHDIDHAIVFNKQFSQKVGSGLFQNLQKPGTLRVVEKIQRSPKPNSGVMFKDFRNLIQASVE